MKKRIISLFVAVIMIASMIPAVMLPSFAASPENYVASVTAETVKVDGILDEAYKNSRKVVSSYWGKGSSSSLKFETYTVVTINGVYVWAEIKDTSLSKSTDHPADQGDKFQIYIKMDNGTDTVWGWYDTDYNGKVAVTSKQGSFSEATYATQKLADGSGWRSETFIPFEGCIDHKGFSTFKIYVGYQANNATFNGSTSTNTAYCYDKDARSPYYYNGTDLYSLLDFKMHSDVVANASLEKTAIFASSTPNVDGLKDSVYSERASFALGKVTKDSTYTGSDTRANLGKVYLAFTGYNLFVYYETEDKDLHSSDYFQVYYEMPDGDSYVSGYFCSKIDPSGSRVYGSTGQNYGYPGVAIENSSLKSTFKQKAAYLGDNKYGLEFQIPLTATIRSALRSGEAEIKIDFSANDYNSSGQRKFYGGCTSYSVSLYNYNSYGDRITKLTLNKSYTNDIKAVITGANVALGSDITVNYYVLMGASDVYNSCMRFTKNGETFIAYPKKAEEGNEYKFSFEGVAPQTIGDNIKAELIIDGMVVATHDGYSVLENCLNIYNDEKYASAEYDDMKMLIKGLLNYGAAAQKYAAYKTDKLVNAGYEIDLRSPTESDSIKTTTAEISSSLKFTAAGVYFDSVNRVYAKIYAKSLSNVSVYINGRQATIQKVEDEENTYIVYSDGISVSSFGSEYRFVLSNGSKNQVLCYSINSYTYSKYESENSATAQLAKALYTYGDIAREYLGLDSVSYKVMTFNDGDNSYAKVTEVSAIINQYKPDVVGMQEVQKKHTQNYNLLTNRNTYQNKLTDYTVVYYDKDKDNHDVPVIYYRTEKFTLVSSGIKWLSDTPDTSSKYDESEYLRCFIWAKLKDKTTGETYMFVNTHLDFEKVSLKQTNKLLELVSSLSGGLPVIFTADWNFSSTSKSAKAMNAAGYYSTESLSDDTLKPGSFPNSDTVIDFCFIDPDEFLVLDYKVINDHEYSSVASDHYAVYSEIVVVNKQNNE